MEKKVQIRNSGGGELALHKLEIACRCFQGSLGKTRLAPGESTQMTIKVLTLKHRGELNDKIGILSNDPAGIGVLAVRFYVPEDVRPEPERLYLGILEPGQEARKEVEIAGDPNVDTKILYAISSGHFVTARPIQSSLSPGRRAILEVVAKAPLQPGTYSCDVSITTGAANLASTVLPVIFSVSQSASVTPAQVDFGRIPHGALAVREVLVKVGKDTTVKDVSVRPDVLESKTVPADDQGTVRLQVMPKRNAPYGNLRGEIRLMLEGAEKSELVVPFTGYLKDENDSGAVP